ncbi:type II secretion system F family protein [Herbiconiux daphne]|uniref:Type II secretion system F family protein n=1 Tax=Herbiconiux daphne TaxID=2970914 RepID=A0ABT2H6F7_9MICO|nr:type II secretion system F family protein [Herbiconiux daphne]MCS5735525.1 type II secretion system F family protein [Herbiconiux daphne]
MGSSRVGSSRQAREIRTRPAAEQLGAVVERLAVLIGAGVTPQNAWSYVAESSVDPTVRAIAARVERGAPIAAAVGAAAVGALPRLELGRGRGSASAARVKRGGAAGMGAAWATVAAAWSVATETGAPLGRCLADIADSLRAVGQVEREIDAALAGPAATTRLVAALPVMSLASGWLLGFDTAGVLFGSPAGVTCLVGGLLLMAAGHVWSSRLLRRARQLAPAPGLALDLVAVAVAGGGSLARATAFVDDTMSRFGLERGADDHAVESVLSLAARAGAPPAELLRSEAARVRRDSVSAANRRAAALGVWLMIPLGLCVLPAFLLLAVAPVVIGVLSSTAFV